MSLPCSVEVAEVPHAFAQPPQPLNQYEEMKAGADEIEIDRPCVAAVKSAAWARVSAPCTPRKAWKTALGVLT
jgi:hypothetical protein